MKVEIFYEISVTSAIYDIEILKKYDARFSFNESKEKYTLLYNKLTISEKYDRFVKELSDFIDDNIESIKNGSINRSIHQTPRENKRWGVFIFDFEDFTEEEEFYIALKLPAS